VTAWFSIEVFDGAAPASLWADAHRDMLTETAITYGATDWSWHRHTWGVVFEVSFDDETAWETFMDLTAVRAVLEAVPDPVTGLITYRGRGGSSGAPFPRKPKPMIGSGSAALPLPGWLSEEIAHVASLHIRRSLVGTPA
jgi:hypothetical protein